MKRWSIKIGQFAGIGVYMHATFLLLIGWLALQHWREGHDVQTTLIGIGFVLSIFGCVILHEFGHALTAKRYGIQTRDIILLPIGGVARLERMPTDPVQELWVALAGPAVNLVIAVICFAILRVTGGLVPADQLTPTQGPFLERLMITNIFLILFNMLPAFPMDGGRVVRALLATRLDYVRATQIAAGLGQALALLFALLGLFSNPMLVFIALFVWIGAAQEANMVQMRGALTGIPVSHAIQTEFHTLSPSDTLAKAIEYILAGSQHDFPVVDDAGRFVGILTRTDLMSALADHGKSAYVGDAMRRDCPSLEASEMLETALGRLQQQSCPSLPVMHNGRLVGMLTSENVGEFLMIQGALRQAKHARSF